jgi:hypothetical protein
MQKKIQNLVKVDQVDHFKLGGYVEFYESPS